MSVITDHGVLEGVAAAREDAGVCEDCCSHGIQQVVQLKWVIGLG